MPETLYLIDYLVKSRALVGRTFFFRYPCGIIYVVIAIMPGGQSGQMRNFAGLGCLSSRASDCPYQGVVTPGSEDLPLTDLTPHM